MTIFTKQTSPYIRKPVTTKRMMSDVLIALLPLVVFAVWKFGADALVRIIIAVGVMILTEVASVLIRHRPHPKFVGFKARMIERFKQVRVLNIITPAISGLIFVLMVPATLPIYVVIVGAFLGILIGKLVFGGLGANIFNPAAVAFVIAHVSFGGLFTYSQIDSVAGATPLTAIGESLLNIPAMIKNYSLMDLFMGNIPGGMGEISAVLIIIGGIYLFVRKAADFRITASFLASFTVLMLAAALVVDYKNAHLIVLYQLLSGGLLYGAVFMVTDPVTSSVTKPGRWIYGLLLGVLVTVFRLFGANPEGVAYSILICNMFAPLIDYHKWSKSNYSYKMWLGYGVTLAVAILIVVAGVGGFN